MMTLRGIIGRVALGVTLACGAGWAATPGTRPTTAAYTPPTFKEFPIGQYMVRGTDADFEFVKKMGTNYVQWYGLRASTETVHSPEKMAKHMESVKAYLDLAQKYDLKVLVNLGMRWRVKEEDGFETFKKIIGELKDHPAVGMWYLYDEPDGHATVEQLRPFYQYLKETTPDIPVAVALNWSEHWTEYRVVTDVILNDLYPVKDKPFPDAPVQHLTTFTARALKLGRTVVPVSQDFNWASFLPKGTQTYGDAVVANMRYPNTAELRYMTFGTVVQGVGGHFYWAYYYPMRHNRKWMEETFAPVSRDLRDFTTQAAPASEPIRLRRAEDDNAYMSLWARPSGQWLMLVNAWPKARELNRWTEGRLTGGRLVPVFGTRDAGATLVKGKVTVQAEPWEVFIWKVEPLTGK